MTTTPTIQAPTFRLTADTRQVPAVGAYAAGYAVTHGRDALGRFASNINQVRVRVTRRGHWYRTDDVNDGLNNDTVCRGCGHHGHFPYILDYEACSSPATAAGVAAALSGPARAFQAGDEVHGYLVALRGHFTATVKRLYMKDNAEVADVETRDGTAATCLTPKDLRRAH